MVNLFIFAPFILALVCVFINFNNNPSLIRNIARLFFFCTCGCSLWFLLTEKEALITLFGLDFIFDFASLLFIFLYALIFFLFSIISRTFILKRHKTFFICSFLLSGLINVFISADNFSALFYSLFWIFLIQYFLSYEFCAQKEDKKSISGNLLADILCFFVSLFFCLGFIKYFLSNRIEMCFSLIPSNLAYMGEIYCAFSLFGLLIIVFRMFNFIPLGRDNFKTDSYVSVLNILSRFILGGYLLAKIYVSFDYVFSDYENFIAIYLIINFIYYLILSLKCSNVLKFITNLIPVYTVSAFFALFSSSDFGIVSFVYFILVLALSYCFAYFVAVLLEYKNQSAEIGTWNKIEDKTHLSQFFVAAAFLNLARVPFLPMFSSGLISFMVIFCSDFQKALITKSVYLLIFGVLITMACVFLAVYKILIASNQNSNKEFILAKHQIITFSVLLLLLIVAGFCPEYLFSGLIVELGSGM